jgi:hypothetical protein
MENNILKKVTILENFSIKESENSFSWVKENVNEYHFYQGNSDVELKLSPGYYGIMQNEDGYYLTNKEIKTGTPKNENFVTFQKSVLKFADKETKLEYERFGLLYKRSNILYGPPGTGKSSWIKSVMKLLIEKEAICISVTNIEQIKSIIKAIRQTNKDDLVFLLFEDVEGIFEVTNNSDILNFVDGNFDIKLDNLIFTYTTNFIDKLPNNFINRPSRVDEYFYVGYPNAEEREEFLLKNIPKEILNNGDFQISHAVNDVEHMSFADIKEYITSIFILKLPYSYVLGKLRRIIAMRPQSDAIYL